MRHILILDFRNNYNTCYIRKSFQATIDNYVEIATKNIVNKDCKSQYSNDDARRILFIFPNNSGLDKQIDLQNLDRIMFEISSHHITKAIFTKDFDSFAMKYHFLCLPQADERLSILTEARFPSELKNNSLYLGNMFNVISDIQLNLLGIKQIMYLTPQRFEDLDQKYQTEWTLVNEKDKPLIDFDEIYLRLVKMLSNGPVLLFCLSGNISGALAIKYLMDTNKVFTLELAMAFVIQRRYELLEMPPWLHAQIQPFGSKKKVQSLIQGTQEEMIE